ncbi:MAG TPA: thiamine pyrophosphate-binding protein [Actinocrinis sp.]|nr:thiamine pyrophosphate-binding protein [Actinocrinis sp.]
MTAPSTVADYLLQRLREWEVDKVFGTRGEGLAGLLAAWERSGNRPELVRGGHEESCAYQAVGYAKLSGRLGVCAASAGPGAIRLLTGLHEARVDQVPILAVIGGTGRSEYGDDDDELYRQTPDLVSRIRSVVGESVHVLTAPEYLPGMLDRAIRGALTGRAPSVVVIPAGMQSVLLPARAYEAMAKPSVVGFEWSSVLPANFAIQRAAEVLNAGRRVAVLAGTGARGAHEEIEYVADLLGAGVAKSLPGKDVVSDDLPYVTGPIGPLGTRPSHELMNRCDTLLTVGFAAPPTRFLPRPGRVRAVQIDTDARRIGTNHPNEVDLVGDAAATLRALIPHLRGKEDRGWREDVEAKVRQWWQMVDTEAMAGAVLGAGAIPGSAPQRAFAELSARLPDNAVVTAESGALTAHYARHLRFRGGMRGVLSGAASAAGSAMPLGLGAKMAFPGRPVIVLTDDTAMQANGLAELITIKRQWTAWADPRLIVAVLRDAQPLDVDYAPFVAGLGLRPIAVDASDHLGQAWDRALTADRPTLLDIRVESTSAASQGRDMRDTATGQPEPPDSGGAGLHALLPRQYRPFDS